MAEASPLGYERIEHVPKTSFLDCSTVVIVPSRAPAPVPGGSDKWPWLHHTFANALMNLMWPMNQKRMIFLVTGAEVGKAYDDQVAAILAHPELSKWKYVMTIEDDTVPPPDAPLKLMEAIEQGPYDGVGGMYHTKGDFNMPQVYGNPQDFAITGVLDFKPLDPTKALRVGGLIECNGIAMGCSLYRMAMFKDIERPWFKTINEYGVGASTQDLAFCSKARRIGKRFAVDCRVRCAHYDWTTGIAY